MFARTVITDGLTSFFRTYVRYVPIQTGKELLFQRIIRPYLSWRPFSTVATTTFGARIAVALPDLIQSRIYFFGFWEPNLTHFIRRALRAGDTFVDVGANIGYFSLLASKIVGERGQVFSVEASPTIHRKLQRNISLNKCRNVRVFNIAASDEEGSLSIYLGNDDNLGATTTVASVAVKSAQKLEAVVPAKPLPAIIGAENLLRARLIKIDVEGAELSVLRGIGQLLGKFGDDTEWVVEAWADGGQGSDTAELLASFRKAGYKLFELPNDYRVGAYIGPSANFTLRELEEITGQADVVASKRR
jgi:FkbM family methyltransferase